MTKKPDLTLPAANAAAAPSGAASARLDVLLTELAATHSELPVPQEALARLEQRFKRESRLLTEQDLEWLAAAGPLFPLSDLKEPNLD